VHAPARRRAASTSLIWRVAASTHTRVGIHEAPSSSPASAPPEEVRRLERDGGSHARCTSSISVSRVEMMRVSTLVPPSRERLGAMASMLSMMTTAGCLSAASSKAVRRISSLSPA
jgi:hypothetical protein